MNLNPQDFHESLIIIIIDSFIPVKLNIIKNMNK